jgi:putative flavoprotein involved in K+ transport
MRTTTVIIIGAGQAGLAMSYHLALQAVDHVLLERGEIANSWRTERWDSLRLLTPNWQSRLPGYAYTGHDPDGFRTMPETVDFISGYAAAISAPVETGTNVLNVYAHDDGYIVATSRGNWRCRCLVIASGACNIANKPAVARNLAPSIHSVTPLDYRNPEDLPQGGVLVVGASATGVQLAQELQRSGRQVTIATGEHVRACRTYRGRDIKWWMDACGLLDMGLAEVDDINRARNVPSMQLVGTPAHENIDLNSLQDIGVTVMGRLAGLDGAKAQFSGGLANVCRLADLKLNRLLSTIDQYAANAGLDRDIGAPERPSPTRAPERQDLSIDLADRGIRTVLWATGYRPDYSWLSVPVLNRKEELRHAGGVVDAPGMYVLGLPFLRRRKSSLIDGVGDDARDLASHLRAYLANPNAAAA